MRFISLIVILALLFTGTVAAAHDYGAFPDTQSASHGMKMPCCPQEHQKSDGMACHYCCAAMIAVMPVKKADFLPLHAVFHEAGESRMASFSYYYLFKPPRSFL